MLEGFSLERHFTPIPAKFSNPWRTYNTPSPPIIDARLLFLPIWDDLLVKFSMTSAVDLSWKKGDWSWAGLKWVVFSGLWELISLPLWLLGDVAIMSNCSSISRSSSLIWSDCRGAVPVVVVFVGIARVFPSPDLKLLSITGETYTSITKKKKVWF